MLEASEKRDEETNDHPEGKNLDREIKREETDEEVNENQDQQEATTVSTEMLLNDRRQYHNFNTSPQFLKNKAETYVTRSLVDRYGPIASPTISPTRPLEKNDTRSHREKSPMNLLDMKTDRDYETATLICSIADSANNLQRNMRELTSSSADTLRVSRISTLLGFPSTPMQDYTNATNSRGTQNNHMMHDHTRISKSMEHVRQYSNGKEDPARADKSYSTPNSTIPDDTDESEYENDDNSMIIRPRDPENPRCSNSNGYDCRLPCCSRVGYSTQFSPEENTHSPIRVPARRPVQYTKECCGSESEQSKCFSRYRDNSKSAFSTVSPTRKRSETEFSYSSLPAIKVRVIKETNPTSEDHPVKNIKQEDESGNYPSILPHHIGNSHVKVKTENDTDSTYQHSPCREDKRNSDVRKENSYQQMPLVHRALSKKSILENSVFTQSFLKENNLVIAKTSSAHVNGQSAHFPSVLSSPYSVPALLFVKRESSPNGNAAPAVQCSTVDSTASTDNGEGESRLLDLARIANEQLGIELAKQPPLKKVKPKSNDCLHLWEFLRDILNSDSMAPHAIEWTVKERGEFRLIKTGVVAQMWGMSKNRTSMTYEKMARAMRYYYKMKILEKVPHKRLHFRFGKHMLPKVLVSKE